MSVIALLSRWFAGRRKPIRSHPSSSCRRSRLRVEDLERRELLSGSPLFLLPTGSGIPVLQVRFKPGPGKVLQVSENGGASFGDLTLVQNRHGLWSGFFTVPGTAGRPGTMVLVDDLNRDGLTDFVINGPDGLTLALTRPDSSLSLYRPLPLSSSGLAPVSILTGDFNQDGLTDVVALSRSRDLDQSQVHLMYGDAALGFRWGESTFTDYAGASPAVSQLVQSRQVDVVGWSAADEAFAGTSAAWSQSGSNVTVLSGAALDDSPDAPRLLGSKKGSNSRSDGRAPQPRQAPANTSDKLPDRDARQSALTADGKEQTETADPSSKPESASAAHPTSATAEHAAPGTAVLLEDAGDTSVPARQVEEATPGIPAEMAAGTPGVQAVRLAEPTAAAGFVSRPAKAEEANGDPAVIAGLPTTDAIPHQPIAETPRIDEETTQPSFHEQILTSLASTDVWTWLTAGPLASTVFALGVIRSGNQPAPVEAAPTENPVDARLLVADLVRKSAETLTKIMAGAFALFLARAAADEEEQGWVGMMLRGKTQEDVFAAFLATAEFDNRASALVTTGTRDERFVESLYRLLLGRSATEAEMGAGLASLPQLGRAGLASLLLRSAEYRKLQVEAMCLELHRNASVDEVSAWVESPFDLLTVRAQLGT